MSDNIEIAKIILDSADDLKKSELMIQAAKSNHINKVEIMLKQILSKYNINNTDEIITEFIESYKNFLK